MSDRNKELAARKAVEYIRDGMVVGLGTGSTAEFAIRALGERVEKEGLEIQCVPTSEASAALGEELGLDMQSLEDNPVIDLTIDGADEVDPNLNLIKGLGGALLREKIVAAASAREVIIIDPGKLVDRLGTRSPLPVEVIPFAWGLAKLRLVDLCRRAELRRRDDDEPYVTDNGNFILDCHFVDGIADAASLELSINQIPGVVENGLFVGLTDIVVVGLDDGQCRVMERST
ncbi:MAG: ribose-5-phosphate isomerase RpiA [bacterium]|nr:ribose-5-phosphate isomerase RpiA [bacterium]